MKKFLLKISVWSILIAALVASCSQDDDGPISIYPDGMSGKEQGFLKSAALDSGRLVHLRSDSLPVKIDSMWTLANCFLKNVRFEESTNDSVLVLHPRVDLEIVGKDCAAPEFYPETTLYLQPSGSWKNVRQVLVYDSDDNLEDSIAMRSGKFIKDTLEIYIDSTFANFYELPRRTADVPAMMRAVDSSKQRVFYWRAMESSCSYVINDCETVPDTLYPSTWSRIDTNLVPIRAVCKDTTLRYCNARDWQNDTTKLSELYEHLDTLWYSTWYLVFKIPKCGVVNKAQYGNPSPKRKFTATQEIFAPATDQNCFSDISSELSVYRLDSGKVMLYPDSILGIFNTAPVGRDTL